MTEAGGGPSEPPPILGSWRSLYSVVLVALAVVIALLYALTRWAS